jgi:hypothetical protein
MLLSLFTGVSGMGMIARYSNGRLLTQHSGVARLSATEPRMLRSLQRLKMMDGV